MTQYTISYSTGTSRHDERLYAKQIEADSFNEAAAYARALAMRKPEIIVTGVNRTNPVFR